MVNMTSTQIIAGCPGSGKSFYIATKVLGSSTLEETQVLEVESENTLHYQKIKKSMSHIYANYSTEKYIHLDILCYVNLRLYWWPLYLSRRILYYNMVRAQNLKFFRDLSSVNLTLLYPTYEVTCSRYTTRQKGIQDKYKITRRSILYSTSPTVRAIFFSKRIYKNLNEAFIECALKKFDLLRLEVLKDQGDFGKEETK